MSSVTDTTSPDVNCLPYSTKPLPSPFLPVLE